MLFSYLNAIENERVAPTNGKINGYTSIVICCISALYANYQPLKTVRWGEGTTVAIL